jgi:hypothetical protein
VSYALLSTIIHVHQQLACSILHTLNSREVAVHIISSKQNKPQLCLVSKR